MRRFHPYIHINIAEIVIYKGSVYSFFLLVYILGISQRFPFQCSWRQTSERLAVALCIDSVYYCICVRCVRALEFAAAQWSHTHTMLWQCIGCVDKAEVSMAFFFGPYNREWRIQCFFFLLHVFVGSGAAVVKILQRIESNSLREWQIHLYEILWSQKKK